MEKLSESTWGYVGSGSGSAKGATGSSSVTLDAAAVVDGLPSSSVDPLVAPTTTMPVVTIAAITAAAEPMMTALIRRFLGGRGGGKAAGGGAEGGRPTFSSIVSSTLPADRH
ncbi:hypothetical protein [Streptomyces griseorubiginosus]|uniref:hypothetical protein n=1 Tax=Streptomyces griseorubiginosus TaxID=67304 RepID=UPI0036DFD95B